MLLVIVQYLLPQPSLLLPLLVLQLALLLSLALHLFHPLAVQPDLLQEQGVVYTSCCCCPYSRRK